MSRSRFVFLGFGSALLFSVFGGCHDSSGAQPARPAQPAPIATAAPTPSDVPSAEQANSAAVPDTPPGPVASGATPALSSSAVVPSSGGASPSLASESPLAPLVQPRLIDAQGKAFAQTDERPALDSASFQQRIALLARAISTGDAESAAAAFFPLLAYEQVKDVAKPERDYKFRLLANFKRDVLEYHHVLGAAAAEAKFDRITVSEKDAKWMAPGSEGNRLGYYRVLRSRLRFTLPTGRTRDFELTSMISWRGEWYVVHLHGFK